MTIKPPIVAFDEAHDLYFFKTISDAESYIEPYDIDVYRLFDWEGKRLKSVKKTGSNIMRIEILLDDDQTHPQELSELIIGWLETYKDKNGKEFIRKWDDYTLEQLLKFLLENELFSNVSNQNPGCMSLFLPRKS
jgi:hypothetical protein